MEAAVEDGVANHDTGTTLIVCPSCTVPYRARVQIPIDQEKFPFPILLMHTASWGDTTVHTLLAYIDQQKRCRHVELIQGKNVMITPFIVYNPELLRMYTYKVED